MRHYMSTLVWFIFLVHVNLQTAQGHGPKLIAEDAPHGGGIQLKNSKSEESKDTAKPKFVNIQFMHGHGNQPRPEKLIVFNTERYGNWSDWSKCNVHDCIEVRYRVCLDDSWTRPSPNRVHTTKCVSKYYVEKRTCVNKSLCSSQVMLDSCGVKPKRQEVFFKILGGQAVEPHSWPWAVRLSVRPPRQNAITFCGGTLISPHWILTAAHCLLVENKAMPVGRLLTLGDHMRSSIVAHLGDHHRGVQEDSQQDHRVTKAILHPGYHRKLMTDGDDIALLYLPEPVNITSEVTYACLPPKDLVLDPGTKCYALGWGGSNNARTTTFNDIQSILNSMFRPLPYFFGSSLFQRPFFRHRLRRPSVTETSTMELHEVNLPIISSEQCRKYYWDLNDELHICAGAKGKDTCSGDSGGGLYCELPKSDKWFVVGVTSFGPGRGCGLSPGVYTSVTGHMRWISKVMAEPVY